MSAPVPPSFTPEQIAAAAAARVQGKHGDLPPVSFDEQVRALEEELPHFEKRMDLRIAAGKVHPATVAVQRKALKQVLATLRALRDAAAHHQGSNQA